MSWMLFLQIFGSLMALLGTFLLRKPGPLAAWGPVCWLVSNPAAMLFMAWNGHWGFFAQHLVFFVLAVDATWHWLVRPRLFNESTSPGGHL